MKIALPSICLLFSVSISNATVSVSGATGAGWVSLGTGFDKVGDESTAQSDIVGDAANPGFFTGFNDNGTATPLDDTIAFRVRLDDHGGAGPSIAFDKNIWIGIDADLNGSVDAFIGVTKTQLTISDSGGGLNNSPNTTTIANTAAFTYADSAANFNYRAVNFATDGGTTNDLSPGGTDTDYYVSCVVSFADVVSFLTTQSITIDKNSHVQYLVATAQGVNLGQDVGRLDDTLVGSNSTTSWTTLGVFSNQVPASVPECSATLLTFIGSVFAFGFRRRR